MGTVTRSHSTHTITIPAGGTTSGRVDLREGAVGLLIIPSGSEVVGKTIQVVATQGDDYIPIPDTDVLETPKSVAAAGAIAFSEVEIARIASLGYAKFKLNEAVTNNTTFYLLWKF